MVFLVLCLRSGYYQIPLKQVDNMTQVLAYLDDIVFGKTLEKHEE